MWGNWSPFSLWHGMLYIVTSFQFGPMYLCIYCTIVLEAENHWSKDTTTSVISTFFWVEPRAWCIVNTGGGPLGAIERILCIFRINAKYSTIWQDEEGDVTALPLHPVFYWYEISVNSAPKSTWCASFLFIAVQYHSKTMCPMHPPFTNFTRWMSVWYGELFLFHQSAETVWKQ